MFVDLYIKHFKAFGTSDFQNNQTRHIECFQSNKN